MSDYLPPVVARLTMDLGDFAAKIGEARAMMQGLGGDFKIGTDGLDTAAAKVKALQAALSGLNGTVKVNTDGLGALQAKTLAAGAAANTAAGLWVGGWRLTANALHWIVAGGAEILAVTVPAIIALGAAFAVAYQGGQMVEQHFEALYTTSEATANMFHQSVGNILGFKSALQEAQNAANPSVYGILGSSLITLNEHFGGLAQTGLSVVQMFQTFAAKVAVEFAPGGSLSNATTELLSHMVADLQGIGQVFGNIGHALLSFASQMPGLAEVLLKGLSGITGLISGAAQLAGRFQIMGVSVLTAAMGFEEFNRWGGLAVSLLTRFGLASATLEGGAFSVARFTSVLKGMASIVPTLVGNLGQLVSRSSNLFSQLSIASGDTAVAGFFGKISTGAAQAGASMEGAAADGKALIAGLSGFQVGGIMAAAAAVGVLTYILVSAKDTAQALASSLQSNVMKATNVEAFQVIAQNAAAINNQARQITAAAPGIQAVGEAEDRAAQTGTRFGASLNMAGIAAMNTKTQLSGLAAGMQQQQQDAANVAAGAQYLAETYHTSLTGALALADAANVKLASGITGTGQAAMVARMQIASLVQGYQAMGAPASAIGSDMEALAIQSGLAGTQVANLNSAWDQFMSNLVGGTSGLSQFEQELQNMGTVVGGLGNRFTQASSISLQTQQFANSLKSFGTAGAQAWQNFDQVVGSTAPQLIDWMRTAGAEGALSGTQFKQGVLDMVSALVPLASQSTTAQAEVMGLVDQVDPSIKTWGQLQQAISASGASISGLGSIVGGATQGMANMNAVTQKLGNVLSTALVSALQAAQVQASGAGTAMQAYATALMNGNQAAASADYATVIGDLEKLGLNAQEAAALVASVTQNLNQLNGKSVTAFVDVAFQQTGSIQAESAAAKAGYASGTPSAAPGWAWVGERGPELVRFAGGETVIPNHVVTGYADGAGYDFGPTVVQVNLDGRQIATAVATRAVGNQRRTGHTGMQRRTR